MPGALVRMPTYELFTPAVDKITRELPAVAWEAKRPQLLWRGGTTGLDILKQAL